MSRDMEQAANEQRDLIDRAFTLLIPQEKELRRLRDGSDVLVHHTSAENAKNILKEPELWLRNARRMPDDPNEIKLGRDCVDRFLAERSGEFSSALNAISPGLWEEVSDCWNAEKVPQIDQTYIASFSADSTGDFIGSAKHWERYGPIAFHFNPAFLKDEPSKLGVYAVKVTYSKGSIENGLSCFLNDLKRDRETLTQVPHDIMVSFIRHRLFFASVGSKSQCFDWEKEWRLVHSPYLFCSADLYSQGEGIDQKIILPLKNTLDGNSPQLNLTNLIRNVVVDPHGAKVDSETHHALISQLEHHGVTDAAARVVFRQI